MTPKDYEKQILALTEKVKNLEAENAALKKELEKEQEWLPTKSAGTHYGQYDYLQLQKYCLKDTNNYFKTEKDVLDFIHRELGFDVDHVELISEVCAYQKNRHGKLRIAQSYQRSPQYASPTWNYIRFNVRTASGCLQWEFFDGHLRNYESSNMRK